MPFAINAITRLAAADWKVDVFLWERPLVDYHEIFPTNRQIPLPSHAEANILWYSAKSRVTHPTNSEIYELHEL